MEFRVLARSETATPSDDGAILRDYFNAGTSLGELTQTWAAKDPRFCSVHPYFPGAHHCAADARACSQVVLQAGTPINRVAQCDKVHDVPLEANSRQRLECAEQKP